MAINFPDSPTTGQIFTSGSTSWIYDGVKWGLNTNVAVSNDSMPVGSIMWYSTTTTPSGWLPADGAAVSRTTYATLFALISTTYGVGDGSTTFNVPSVSATTGKYFVRYTTSLGAVTTTSLATSPVGTMLDWPVTSSYPTGFLRADGSAVSRTSYADLFSLIGTTYGTGDGSTTFNLPNLVAAGSGSPVNIIKASLGGTVEPSTVAHASSHIRGGSDIIDADRDQIDFIPSYYTRDSSPAQAGAVTDLTAHLKGVDNFIPYGMLVFTTEAARNAAIISPVEGMRAYITAPTEISVTGDNVTSIPTGIETVYNGVTWVCVTPIGANTEAQGYYGAAGVGWVSGLSGGGTNVSVTLRTGTHALIHIHAGYANITAANGGGPGVNISGASSIGPASLPYAFTRTYSTATASSESCARSFIINNLTAGINTFTMYYTANGGSYFDKRSITVQGVA